MDIEIRAFAVKDMANVVSLLNEKSRESYEFIPMTEERTNAWMGEGRLRILVAERDRQFLGSAAYNDGHWGEEIEWLVVTETQDRKALENNLVKEVEKYVRNKKVFTSVDAGSPKINDWTERGYKPEGGLYHMIADLDGVRPIPKVPAGIVLRSLVRGEEEKFVKAVNAGFIWERLKQDGIQKWKIDSPDFNEEWIHVAVFDDTIVSVVVAKRDVNYNRFFRGNRGYLGPAATLPEYRGKNLASALTRRAMNFLFDKGMDSAALYTSEQNVASVALLQKLGFRIGHDWKFMRKDLSQNTNQNWS
jgi:ribosomal protein S18 acetylase RimI-like enzyme